MAAVEAYAKSLNHVARQFCEDKAGAEIMTKMGFSVSVLSLPVVSTESVTPLPAEPAFLVDVGREYGNLFNAIQVSIPDIKLEQVGGTKEIEKYTGFVSFHKDRLLRQNVKRMLAAGRTVVSNIQAPFCGYLNDRVGEADFLRDFVGKIRAAAKAEQSKEQVKFWINPKAVEKFKEAVLA